MLNESSYVKGTRVKYTYILKLLFSVRGTHIIRYSWIYNGSVPRKETICINYIYKRYV